MYEYEYTELKEILAALPQKNVPEKEAFVEDTMTVAVRVIVLSASEL